MTNPDRTLSTALWRDVVLYQRGCTEAGERLKARGFDPQQVAAIAPVLTAEQIVGFDSDGQPLDPDHTWWS